MSLLKRIVQKKTLATVITSNVDVNAIKWNTYHTKPGPIFHMLDNTKAPVSSSLGSIKSNTYYTRPGPVFRIVKIGEAPRMPSLRPIRVNSFHTKIGPTFQIVKMWENTKVPLTASLGTLNAFTYHTKPGPIFHIDNKFENSIRGPPFSKKGPILVIRKQGSHQGSPQSGGGRTAGTYNRPVKPFYKGTPKTKQTANKSAYVEQSQNQRMVPNTAVKFSFKPPIENMQGMRPVINKINKQVERTPVINVNKRLEKSSVIQEQVIEQVSAECPECNCVTLDIDLDDANQDMKLIPPFLLIFLLILSTYRDAL